MKINKRFVTPVLAASLFVGGLGFTANAESTISGITFDDGSDFTIVKQVNGNERVDLKGLDAGWQKVDLPSTAEIQWLSSDETVAKVTKKGKTSAIITVLKEGRATITAKYGDKTVTSNVVVERAGNEKSEVKKITVVFDKNNDKNITEDEKFLKEEAVPMFNLDNLKMVDSKGNKVIPNDVLTKDPTVLHAVLYAIEKEHNPNAKPGDLTWVQAQLDKKQLRIESEGSYISILLGKENSWTEGWQYKIENEKNGNQEGKEAASIHKLNEGDTVKFEYRAFEW